MSTGELPNVADETDPNMLEMIAKAVAFCHFMRIARRPNPSYVETVVDRRWREFEHDARMIIEVINGLVQREEMEAMIADLPQLPAFLSGAVN